MKLPSLRELLKISIEQAGIPELAEHAFLVYVQGTTIVCAQVTGW